MPIRKTEFPIIKRDVNETYIALRLTDGYVNASALCEACDKNLDDYIRLKTTDEFMKELSKEINIPVSDLVQPFESRNRTINGTWVHPQMAINLAQWASPKLAVLVPQWVFLWMSEQSTDVKESPVENPKNKFDDYDPNFKRLIQKAIAYDPRKGSRRTPKK